MKRAGKVVRMDPDNRSILKFFVRISFLFERGKNCYSRKFTSFVRPKFDETKSEEKDQEEQFTVPVFICYTLYCLYISPVNKLFFNNSYCKVEEQQWVFN